MAFIPRYTISQIQTPLLQALQGHAGLAAICKHIAVYSGEVDTLVEKLKQYVGPVPATFVFYAGSQFDTEGSRSYSETQTWTLVTLAKNLSGIDALQGSAYAIIEQQKQAVINNDLGLDIEPFKPLRIEPLLITREFAVYSFEIETFFSLD
jgi:phage gp37-like protein